MNLRLAVEGLSSRNAAYRVNSSATMSLFAGASVRAGRKTFAEHLTQPLTERLDASEVHQVPAPKKIEKRSEQKTAQTTAAGLLSRALSWLRGNVAHEKKLRVIETVPLGEKRIVAIVEAEGQRFLVGCGSEGVSLLTPLHSSPKTAGPLLPSFEAAEVAE